MHGDGLQKVQFCHHDHALAYEPTFPQAAE